VPAAGAIRAETPGAFVRIAQANVPPVLEPAGRSSFSFLMWLQRSGEADPRMSLLDVPGAISVSIDAADRAVRARLAGSPAALEVLLPLQEGGSVPLGQWILLAVSFDRASGTLQGWARSELIGPVHEAVRLPGFSPAAPSGDLLIGAADSGSAQPGLYGLMVFRDHPLARRDVENLWAAQDYLGPYRLENTASGGSLDGPEGVVWMVNHAIPTLPTGGVIPLRSAALVGGAVAATNFCVYGRGPGAGPSIVDAGAVDSVSSGPDAFVFESPYDGGFFHRRPADAGLPGPPALVAMESESLRRLALDRPAGVQRVLVSGNSRAISPGDADQQTFPENFAHGLIASRLASTAGVLNRRATAGGGQRWFGYDCTDPPRSSGTITGIDATSLPERSFSRLWTGSVNAYSAGPGGGLFLRDGAGISIKCRPEAGSLMDGPGGDGTAADFPLRVRAYVGRFPGSGSALWRPEKSSGQSVAGSLGPPAVAPLDTTVYTHVLSSSAGDRVEPATRILRLSGDHGAGITAGDGCFVSQGAGEGGISLVQSVSVLPGPTTQVVLEKWFMVDPTLDSSVLRFGPVSVHAIEHEWPELSPGDLEIWRGLEVTATGGHVVLFSLDAWRPGVCGWAFGTYGSGGMGYGQQIEVAHSAAHERAIAALAPDVWLQSLATQNSSLASMVDFLKIVRAGAPGAEVAWVGDAAHLSPMAGWHQFMMDNAASARVPAVSAFEEPDVGLLEDQSADGLRADLSHFSHRGNVRLAERWLSLLARATAPREDLDGDGSVGIADLLTLLASWGPCPSSPCPADLDRDGEVGHADLLALLSAWS
jgi:hypothetical protein